MIIKRSVRKIMFHGALPFVMLSIMGLMISIYDDIPLLWNLSIIGLIISLIVVMTPIAFVLLTPFEKLEEERNDEDWKND